MESQLFDDLYLSELDNLELDDDTLNQLNLDLTMIKDKIATEGLCYNTFVEAENIYSGVLSSHINSKHCTVKPSSIKQKLAVESISSILSGGLTVAGSLAVFKMIETIGKNFQSNRFELDIDINAERFRRAFNLLKETEDKAYKQIWESFTDVRAAFDNIASRKIRKHQNERNKVEVYQSLKKYLERKINVYESVSLLLLANFCVNYEASAYDYNKIVERMLKFKTYKSQRALTTGLAVLRSGVSGKLLLKDAIGFNYHTSTDLVKLSVLTTKTMKLLADPHSLGSSSKWEQEALSLINQLDLINFRSLNEVNTLLTAEGNMLNEISNLKNARIGFWSDSEAKPQGEQVIPPEAYTRELERIFSLSSVHEAVKIKNEVKVSVNNFKQAVNITDKKLDKKTEEYLAANPEIKQLYRNLTAAARKTFSTGLRVSSVMVNYCEGYADMISYCKNLNRAYSSSVSSMLNM